MSNKTKSSTIALKDKERPTIVTSGRFMRDITSDAICAVMSANSSGPTVFQRGGHPARLRNINSSPWVEIYTPPALKGHLDRVADFTRVKHDGSQEPGRPPDEVIRDIINLPELPLPEIVGITEVPVVLPGGCLLITPGYDIQSRLYVCLNRLKNLDVDMPLDVALSLIKDELFVDFCFSGAGSLANAFACLLQPFVRPVIDGCTPIYLVGAPRRGEGKDLTLQAIAQVNMGHPAAVMAQPRDEDETRKRITALLLEGHQTILMANVTDLKSGVLAAAVTSPLWMDRLLGQNKILRVENNTTWLATGNNVTLSDEIARRTIPIRLDSGLEFPELRQDFKHDPLLPWVQQNRPQLVSACLSIVMAWVSAGMPLGKATLGSFESWSRVMGGILEVAGIPGFLEGREELYRSADTESDEWRAFLKIWWATYGPRGVTAGDLFTTFQERHLLLDLWSGRSDLGGTQRLGHALQHQRDRVYGQYAIRQAGRDPGTGNQAYRLEPAPIGGSKTPETPETQTSSLPLFETKTGDYGVSGVFGKPVPPVNPQESRTGVQIDSDQDWAEV